MTQPSKIERNIARVLEKGFPRYLLFREKYLVPLRGLPDNPNWRKDTHPLLEQIGVNAYAIIKSINFIHHRKNFITISDYDQSFKNIYFHFGLIFDCIESFSRCIILIEQSLGLIDLELKLKISRQGLIDKFIDWVDKEYDKKYIDLIEDGKPIYYYPQNDHTYLSLILKNPIKRKYNVFAKSIKDYRNYFIHNPGVDVLNVINTSNLFTIKKEFVDRTKNWANIQVLFDRDRDMFVNPLDMINQDLQELLLILDESWLFFIDRLEKVYEHQDFENLMIDYKREI